MSAQKLKLRNLPFIIFFALLILYCLFQARFLILGPQVWVTNLTNGQVVAENLLDIEGLAKNISWISLNGRQIFTDETGKWKERLIVSSGINIIAIRARDRFGRETNREVEIYLNDKTDIN